MIDEAPEIDEPGAEKPGSAGGSAFSQEKTALQGVQEFRRRALALGFGIITLSVLALLITIYLQFAKPIFWGLALAVLFFPVHREILRLVGGRVTVAAGVSTVLSLAVIFVPAVLLVFNLIDEVQSLWPRIQATVGPETYQALSQWLDASPFRRLAHWVLGVDSSRGPVELEAEMQRIAIGVQEFLLGRLRSMTKSVPKAAVQLMITITVYFFFLRHGPGWLKQVGRALPLAPEFTARLFRITERTINAVFRGVILTAATQAILAGLGYWFTGALVPLLLASATFIAALIPFIGPVVVWVPVAVGLHLTGNTGGAIALAIWGTLVVSLVDNVLRPYLIGREMKLPLLWLLLAILGGLKLFGFLGIVVGPITLALAAACYRIYFEERRTPSV